MTHLFDTYDETYRQTVQSSIDFSGLPHSFFYAAKADMIRAAVARHFGADRKPAALDVGCGIGIFHPFIRDTFATLSAVDMSSACIAQARRDNPGIDYKSCQDAVLPYRDAEFDLAYAICVVHHVPPADWPFFMRQMRRVVRPGGLVCIIEHNPFNPLTQLSVRRCEFDRDAVLLGARRTERLMSEAGFGAVESRHFLLLPSAAPLARRVEGCFARLPFGAQYMTTGRA